MTDSSTEKAPRGGGQGLECRGRVLLDRTSERVREGIIIARRTKCGRRGLAVSGRKVRGEVHIGAKRGATGGGGTATRRRATTVWGRQKYLLGKVISRQRASVIPITSNGPLHQDRRGVQERRSATFRCQKRKKHSRTAKAGTRGKVPSSRGSGSDAFEEISEGERFGYRKPRDQIKTRALSGEKKPTYGRTAEPIFSSTR